MKVLLTGANGFVGSHILDALRADRIPVALLLRAKSDRRFIQPHLEAVELGQGGRADSAAAGPEAGAPARPVELHEGVLEDAAALDRALAGVTHVIHCAGATKALRNKEFFTVNQLGTRHLVDAINRHGQIQRLVHLSSLAAAGPSSCLAPLSEGAPAEPVSTYGHSKLAGEEEVTTRCGCEFTILRPPAVYGPRDAEFLRLFKAVKLGLKPVFGTGQQELSFVYVEDLARAAVHCLTSPAAARQTFFVTERGIFTTRQFADKIAEVMRRNAFLLRIPIPLLYPLGMAQDVLSQMTRRPNVLSRQKYPELRAEAWTCDGSRLQIETGFLCRTGLTDGLRRTRGWYQQEKWL
jgi:nucleoside-diphosphate-sugar epimerase